jgi:hypothetical protein
MNADNHKDRNQQKIKMAQIAAKQGIGDIELFNKHRQHD